jgi:sterol desaturase/sphingolipid hydroxylase (fatty acid hydroxylase superfamily)
MELEIIWNYVLEHSLYILKAPFEPNQRFFLGYLIMFLFFSFISYRLYFSDKKDKFSFKKALGYIFSKKIYFHKSAIMDYKLYIINIFLGPVNSFFGIISRSMIAILLGDYLISLIGEPLVIGDWSLITSVVFIIGLVIVSDFSVYVSHRFHHYSNIIWPFHAVHHSAEVLTPATLFRKHPMWNIISFFTETILTGIFQAIFLVIFYGNTDVKLVLIANSIYYTYNFFGSHLRHSHMWLQWPKSISYVFMSPAMHQIHHSVKKKHFDRNFGEIFSLWDTIFRTVYIPEKYEEIKYGLVGDLPNPHTSLKKAYFLPFVESFNVIKKKIK